MADILHGQLLSVIDGTSFQMRVTHLGKNNRNRYSQEERISVVDIKSPESEIINKEMSKSELEEILKGHAIKCIVQKRDHYGRLNGKIRLL